MMLCRLFLRYRYYPIGIILRANGTGQMEHHACQRDVNKDTHL